jgi:hypothetical protein
MINSTRSVMWSAHAECSRDQARQVIPIRRMRPDRKVPIGASIRWTDRTHAAAQVYEEQP